MAPRPTTMTSYVGVTFGSGCVQAFSVPVLTSLASPFSGLRRADDLGPVGEGHVTVRHRRAHGHALRRRQPGARKRGAAGRTVGQRIGVAKASLVQLECEARQPLDLRNGDLEGLVWREQRRLGRLDPKL